MTIMPQCAFCKHFQGHAGVKSLCTAFPKGIPEAILENEFDHRLPYLGDNGVRFEPTEKALELFGEQGPFAEKEPIAETVPKERVA